MRIITLFILLFLSISIQAQTNKEWFPDKLNIQPFTANLLEARNGSMFAPGKDKLRLDIGVSKDFLQFKSEGQTISFGADLFTYTRLRSEGKFKFPVETIDYFFGLNAGYKKKEGKVEFGARFRVSHISAHLVDGKFNEESNRWIEGREPFVYSKEFVELFPYYKISGMRIYLGFTYIFHIVPNVINNGIYQTGFDYYLISSGLKSFMPFIGLDFKLTGIDGVYSGNTISKVGLKFGTNPSKGFSILLSYISGKSIHGEFYDINENYLNFGFNLDL